MSQSMSPLIRVSVMAVVPPLALYIFTSFYQQRNSTTDTDSVKDHTNKIVQKIHSQSWSYLRSDFIPPIRIFLTASLLEKGWNVVQKSFGRLESTGDPIIMPGWFLTTVKVPLQLQHAEFGLALLFASAGGLIGLHFTGLGKEWQPPSYADKEAAEIDLVLGQGKFNVGATLCLPSSTTQKPSKIPCVIFIAGSGPCDRDSTIGENKPFKDIAVGLAGHGIASIRIDKVTHTHPKAFRSLKNFTLSDEYIEHAIDAIKQGRSHSNIDPSQVYILGHSLGAVVAPRLADMDTTIAGCIIMAGPAEPLYKCYIRQLKYIQSLDGPESLYINKQIDDARMKAEVADSHDLTLSTPKKKLPFGIGPAYWLNYREFKPIETTQGLKCPVLVMQGCRDYQVTVQDDYEQWHAALSEKDNVNFRLYEELNHLFVAGTGLSTPLGYSVQGNVDERVVLDISEWMYKLCKTA